LWITGIDPSKKTLLYKKRSYKLKQPRKILAIAGQSKYMTKTTKIVIGVVVVLIIIGGIWYGVARQPKQAGEIKIGVSAVLTGEAATWGQSVLAGVTLATEEINNAGGINGKKVNLIVEDDKMQATDAANAVNKLINIDNVTALMAGTSSGATSSIVPIAKQNKTPLIITVASAPNLADGDYVFRVDPSDSVQGKFSAQFIKNQMGFSKIALIYAKNDWGQGIADVFKKNFVGLGGEIVYETGILQEAVDLRTEIAKIKNTNAQAIYAPIYPNNALAFFRQAKEAGLNLPIICGDAIETQEVIGNEYADGVIYNIAKISSPAEFAAKIKGLKGFENLTMNIGGPLGYDAAKILFSAIEKAGTDKVKIREELTKTSYKNGVSNPVIEFDSNGDISTPVFEAKIIKNKQSVPYQK